MRSIIREIEKCVTITRNKLCRGEEEREGVESKRRGENFRVLGEAKTRWGERGRDRGD